MNGFGVIYDYDCGRYGYMIMYVVTHMHEHWDSRTVEKSWWIVPGTLEA